jgi:hypothetical protein
MPYGVPQHTSDYLCNSSGNFASLQSALPHLSSIALAIGMTLATRAFALPYCPNHGHYVCTDYEQ